MDDDLESDLVVFSEVHYEVPPSTGYVQSRFTCIEAEPQATTTGAEMIVDADGDQSPPRRRRRCVACRRVPTS
jgi:hypothetical protein